MQIDFGPIFAENGNEIYFLAAIDRFSEFPIACIYETVNRPNVLKFLDKYIETQGIARSIRLNQAKYLVLHQVKTFCNRKDIEIIEAHVNDHRAIGLVERLIQTIKNRLACIKQEKPANSSFNTKHAQKIIIHKLRICVQKTTTISPSEALFGRKPITPLSMISKPELSNLSYENIVNYYLDKYTFNPEAVLPDDKWINGYQSGIEVEKGMTRATKDAKSESDKVRTENCDFSDLDFAGQCLSPKEQST